MDDFRGKELKLSIILKVLILIGGLIGLIASFLMTEIGANNEILYFTVQSNIWIFLVMAVFLVFDCVSLVKGKEKSIPQWLWKIKFVFTVAIALTGFVYNFVLFPVSLATTSPTNPLKLDSFFVHIFVPVLAIVDFIRFDYRLNLSKWTVFLGLATSFYYLPFALIVAELGASFKEGSRFPYFFLNHEKFSWFGFNGMPGVFYWLLIVLGIVLGISYLLIIFQKKRKKQEKIKKFTHFREKYAFECKKLLKNAEGIFLGDYCIEDKDGNKVFENDEIINTSYASKNSISRILSNLYPHSFKFKGKKVSSIEGVLQGIKYKDKKLQNAVLKYFGTDAYHTRACNIKDFWGENGKLYWQGKVMQRNSQDYQEFLDQLYICACESPLYKKALLSTGDKYLMHHIGNTDEKQTVLTRYEYELRMNALREFLRRED
ncbi:MAG: hypothetical protein E7379_04175 [Clostridiales bacterium]|nr:hypothetical protein [Clostridiales bacterium]